MRDYFFLSNCSSVQCGRESTKKREMEEKRKEIGESEGEREVREIQDRNRIKEACQEKLSKLLWAE